MENPIQSRLDPDGTAVVDILGEIDFTNADEISQGIQSAVHEWSPEQIRIDLREATFIDSTGLGALIAGYRAAVEEQVAFTVVNPSDAFRRVLTVTGLCDLFGLTDRGHASAADRTSDIAI